MASSSSSTTSHLPEKVYEAWKVKDQPLVGDGWRARFEPVQGVSGQMRIIVDRTSDALPEVCPEGTLALSSSLFVRHQPYYSFLLRERGLAACTKSDTAWIAVNPWKLGSTKLLASYLLATTGESSHRQRLEKIAEEIIVQFASGEFEPVVVAQLAAIGEDWLKKVWKLGPEVQLEALRLVPHVGELWLLEQLEICAGNISGILDKILPGPGSESERELTVLLQLFGALLDRMAQTQESWLREEEKAKLVASLQKIKLESGLGFGASHAWRRLRHRGVIRSNSQILYLASYAQQSALRFDEDVSGVSSTVDNVKKGVTVAKEVGGAALKLWSALRAFVTLDFEKVKDKAKSALENGKKIAELGRKPRPEEWYPMMRYLEELAGRVIEEGSDLAWKAFKEGVKDLSEGDSEYKYLIVRRLDQGAYWPLVYAISQSLIAIHEECSEEKIRTEAFEQIMEMFIDQFKSAYPDERKFGTNPAVKFELMRAVMVRLSQLGFRKSLQLRERLHGVMPKLSGLEAEIDSALGSPEGQEKILSMLGSLHSQDGPNASEHGTAGAAWRDLKRACSEFCGEASDLLGLTPRNLQRLFLPYWVIHSLYATVADSRINKEKRECAVACLGALYRTPNSYQLDGEPHALATRALLRLHRRFDSSKQITIPSAIADQLSKNPAARNLSRWCEDMLDKSLMEISKQLDETNFQGQDRLGYWLALEGLVDRMRRKWYSGWRPLFDQLYALSESRGGVDPIRFKLEQLARLHKLPLDHRQKAEELLCKRAQKSVFPSLDDSIPFVEFAIPTRVQLDSGATFPLMNSVKQFLSNDDQRLFLLKGDTGSGKTTAMSEIYSSLLECGSLYLPIRIPLDELRKEDTKVSRYISGRMDPDEERKVVFLFDAYDAMAARSDLFDFKSEDWPEAKFIVSCQPQYLIGNRPPLFRSELSGPVFSIAPLRNQDRKSYLQKRLGQVKAKEVERLVASRPDLAELTLLPINLSSFAEISSAEIQNRLDLFSHLMDTRFEDRLKLHEDFLTAKSQMQHVCERIALHMFEKGLLSISKENLGNWVEGLGSKPSGDTIERWLLSDADPVLRSRRAAPLHVDNKGNISFEHETLLDYFAACAFAKSPNLASKFPLSQRPSFCQFVRDLIDRNPERAEIIQTLWSSVRGPDPIATGNAFTILNYLGENGADKDLPGIVVEGADLQGFSFWGAKLSKAKFVGCLATDVNFDRANLRGATLDGIDHRRSPEILLCDKKKIHFLGRNGSLIAFTSEGKVWELSSNFSSKKELFVPPAGIREAVVSPNGDWLAYCTESGTAVVHDLVKDTELWRDEESQSFSYATPFVDSEKSCCWFFNSGNRLVRLDVEAGTLTSIPIEESLSFHGGTRDYLIFTRDKEQLVLYDTTDERFFDGPKVLDWISAIVPSPSGDRLAVANAQGLFVWDRKLNISVSYPCFVRTLSWTGNDEALAIAVGTGDSQLNIIDVVAGDQLNLRSRSVYQTYTPIMSLGAGLEQDCVVAVFDTGLATQVHISEGNAPRLSGLIVAPDILSSGLLSTWRKGVLLPAVGGIFQLNSSRGLGQFLITNLLQSASGVACNSTSSLVAAVDRNLNLYVCDCSEDVLRYIESPAKSGKIKYVGLRDQSEWVEDNGPDDVPPNCWGHLGLELHSLSFSPNGDKLLEGSHYVGLYFGRLGNVAVWDRSEDSVLSFVLENSSEDDTGRDPPHCAGWIDNTRILLGSKEGLDLFDLEKRTNQVLVERSVLNLVASVEFQRVAVIPGVKEPEQAVLWNLASEQPLSISLCQTVSCFTFGSSYLLVGGNHSGEIYLWNIQGAKPQLQTQLSIWGGVRSLAVAPAGEIVVGDLDGGILAWSKLGKTQTWGVIWQQGRSTTFLNAQIDGLSVTPDIQMRVVKQTLEPWRYEYAQSDSTASDVDEDLEPKSDNHWALAGATLVGLLAAGLIVYRWRKTQPSHQ